MIRRLAIKGYKSLVDAEIYLQPLTVIFGPNAAGKSNFLDALQLLSRLVQARTLREAFDPPYRGTPLESFTFGADGIASNMKRADLSFSIEVDVELTDFTVTEVERQVRQMRQGQEPASDKAPRAAIQERYLRYRIELEILPASGVLRVKDEYLAALTKGGEINQARKPYVHQVDGRLRLRTDKNGHPTNYELGLDHTILSRPHYPPHYPHLVALRQELSRWFFFYFEPRERMRAVNPVKEVRHIGMMGEELAAFLNTLRLTDEPQFRNVQRALHLLIPSITGIDVRPNEMGEVDLYLREGEVAIPARLVSEGTLRLLGLLALAGVKEPPALIGFEEPENGITPRRIELVAEYLMHRSQSKLTQLIVTTHSTVLLENLPPGALFVSQRPNGRTTITPLLPTAPLGALDRERLVSQGLLDDAEETSISTRILRGDFDA